MAPLTQVIRQQLGRPGLMIGWSGLLLPAQPGPALGGPRWSRPGRGPGLVWRGGLPMGL